MIWLGGWSPVLRTQRGRRQPATTPEHYPPMAMQLLPLSSYLSKARQSTSNVDSARRLATTACGEATDDPALHYRAVQPG